mmetsp:Transcript_2241/g.2536  ORF Transcript_2241/g.2536 Transcript_2241/m.2536 type:complete len:257 (+) Transcript_2241:255-1025(+)
METHQFETKSFKFPTSCGFCSQIIRPLKKGMHCRLCKLSLHKKCFSEYDIDCPQQKAGEDKTVNDAEERSNRIMDGELDGLFEQILSFIRENLDEQGLFRIPGDRTLADSLMKKYEKQPDGEFLHSTPGVGVAEACSLFKLWVGSLGTNLVPDDDYTEINNLINQSGVDSSRDRLVELTNSFPERNKDILLQIVDLLNDVAANEEKNKMSSLNLAICLSPCLLPPPSGTPPTALVKNLKSCAAYIVFLMEHRDSLE